MIHTSYHRSYIQGKQRRMIQGMRRAWERGEKTMMITTRQCRILGRKIPEFMIYDEAFHLTDLDWKLLVEQDKEN